MGTFVLVGLVVVTVVVLRVVLSAVKIVPEYGLGGVPAGRRVARACSS